MSIPGPAWARRLAALIAVIPAPLVAQEPASGGGGFAFVDVSVVPMDAERVLERQTVVVRGRRIAAIGDAATVRVPAGATRIDGRGKFLMPGLAEMHGHLPLPSRFYPRRWPEDVLFLYVANGITTVRGMQGQQPHLEMRAKIESGTLLGPRIYVACPPLTGRGRNPVRSAEQGERLVREYRDAGYDLLKIHEGIPRDAYVAIASTAKEVRIRFAGHVPDDVGFFDAVDLGQITVDHLDNMYDAVDGDEDRIGSLVQALRDRSAWVVPTEVLWESAYLVAADPAVLSKERTEIRYVPQSMVAQWSGMLEQTRAAGADPAPAERRVAFRRRLIKELSDAGVGVLLGTDSPQIFSVPGFSLHREMRVMVEAGMTPYQVLASGTRRVSEYFGTEATTGTVAVGKRADLLLVDGNPLEDVARLADRSGVMVNGRWLPEELIQVRLREIERAYARDR